MNSIRSRPNRKGGALYLSVISTAMIVTLLGLAGLKITQIERGQMAAGSDQKAARMNANSAVELALRALADNSDWRSDYGSGTETPLTTLGPNADGHLSWMLEDADGSLSNADVNLKLKGIGRVGNSVQVSTLSLASSEIPVGPTQLRSQNVLLNVNEGQLDNNHWWCQYLKPDLPANATRWWVTSVEIYCRRINGSRTFQVRLYEPLPSNWPSSTLIDEVSINSNTIGFLLASFHTFNLSGTYALDPNQGICLALETSADDAPIALNFLNGGVSEANSALIQGDPVWNSYSASKALRYRVHGMYQVPSSEVTPITGTWVWDMAP